MYLCVFVCLWVLLPDLNKSIDLSIFCTENCSPSQILPESVTLELSDGHREHLD